MKFLYKIRVATKLQEINRENGDTENLYNQIKSRKHEAAEEALGYQERQHQQNPEWWSIEVKQLVKKKNKADETWLHTNTAENRKIYAQCNRVLKRTITERKNETREKKCEEVNGYMGGTRVAEAWKTIKNVRKDTRCFADDQVIVASNEIGTDYKLMESKYKHIKNKHCRIGRKISGLSFFCGLKFFARDYKANDTL